MRHRCDERWRRGHPIYLREEILDDFAEPARQKLDFIEWAKRTTSVAHGNMADSASLIGPATGQMISSPRSVVSTIAVIAASFLLAEVIFRLADFRELRQDSSERSLSYDYDAELGWAPVPSSEATVTTARTIHIRHNSLGFRDIEYKPDERPVILSIGDSFVWGVDAESNERFTDLLRERITRFSILNAGVSG